jgi:hypothetical protein
MFELVRFGCGQGARCKGDCGGSSSCRTVSSGDLETAIKEARHMIDDPLGVVEVRDDGLFVCTVGRSWMSRRSVLSDQRRLVSKFASC